jgi:hypothetical protein
MKCLVYFSLAVLLTGCNATTQDGTPVTTNGTLTGLVRKIASPGSTYMNRAALDDKQCRDYGFVPGTQAYGGCRLQLENARQAKDVTVTVR